MLSVNIGCAQEKITNRKVKTTYIVQVIKTSKDST